MSTLFDMKTRLDMIGLVCKSIPESLKFYRLLGLEVEDQPGEPYVETVLEGGIRLSWNDLEMIKGLEPDWKPPVGQGIGLAFLCGSPAEVDVLYANVTAAGFASHRAPWDAFWGQRYAQVVDPDGYVVDLFAALEA